MNIVCFTDTLGSGGAQRQLVMLASLLKARQHEVRFVTYGPGEHFAADLAAAGIPRERLGAARWARPIALRALLRRIRPDAVIAFQDAPAFYAELASAWGRTWRLVVSERHASPPGQAERGRQWRRHLHRLADAVTTNSMANQEQIEAAVPALRGRVTPIYNGVDLQRFRPRGLPADDGRLRLVVLSSHKPSKNGEGLCRALRLLLDEGKVPPLEVVWYGDEAPGGLACDERWRQQLGLADVLTFHPSTPQPEAVLASADAFLLPSLWEGLPNAACEALASGCPVLIGEVADARQLVDDGVTGFRFDPTVPAAIARAIRRFCALSAVQRAAMRAAARVSAERLFDPSRYVAAYERVLAPASAAPFPHVGREEEVLP